MSDRTCAGCGVKIVPHPRETNPRRWCSERCRVAATRPRRPAFSKCAGCETLIAKPLRGATKKWCSPECRHAATYVPKPREFPPVDRTCVACGCGFVANSPVAQYCSETCRRDLNRDARRAKEARQYRFPLDVQEQHGHDVEMTQPLTPSQIVAERVRAVREGQRISADALAERCAARGAPEITRSVIANIENGRRGAISVDQVMVLARCLHVTPIDLMTWPASDMSVGSEVVGAWIARDWIGGRVALNGTDALVLDRERLIAQRAAAEVALQSAEPGSDEWAGLGTLPRWIGRSVLLGTV